MLDLDSGTRFVCLGSRSREYLRDGAHACASAGVYAGVQVPSRRHERVQSSSFHHPFSKRRNPNIGNMSFGPEVQD